MHSSLSHQSSFLSCDWGTSSFRLRLVNTESLEIIAEEISSHGILETFNQWKLSESQDPQERLTFYIQVIRQHLENLKRKGFATLDSVPLVISGMASSTIGMMSLPYHMLPFSLDGEGLETKFIPASPAFNHDITIISGVQSQDDVMRGEETQLIGLYSAEDTNGESVYILPGTHSKHITVSNNQAVRFKTYMTGEFFDLLSQKSILHANVEKTPQSADDEHLESFKKGVHDAPGSNILHSAFTVRTNDLFGLLTKKENYAYLSGLLIGSELQDLLDNDSIIIYLCCGAGLKRYYETALQTLGLGHKTKIFSSQLVDESVIKGQSKILFKQTK